MKSLLFPFCFDHVLHRYNRVGEYHSRSGITHNLFYFSTHIGLIAMNPAITAKRFIVAVRTLRQAKFNVGKERFAIFAKFSPPRLMYAAAIFFYHQSDRFQFFFFLHSLFFQLVDFMHFFDELDDILSAYLAETASAFDRVLVSNFDGYAAMHGKMCFQPTDNGFVFG